MTGFEQEDPRIEFLSLEEAMNPPREGFYNLMLDRWWMAHPEKGLVLYRPTKKCRSAYPQCNSQKEIAERFLEMYPWATLLLVKRCLIQIDVRDY